MASLLEQYGLLFHSVSYVNQRSTNLGCFTNLNQIQKGTACWNPSLPVTQPQYICLHSFPTWPNTYIPKHSRTSQSHPPLSELSGIWPVFGASGSVKLASSLGCADARVRRLRWGCCTWQGLVLHHVFHSRFSPSCGCRRKRLWLRRRVLWLPGAVMQYVWPRSWTGLYDPS